MREGIQALATRHSVDETVVRIQATLKQKGIKLSTPSLRTCG